MSKQSSESVITPGIIEEISISRVKEDRNIRNCIMDVGELAMSIKQKGLLHPILVRPQGQYFQIVAGNRRSRL